MWIIIWIPLPIWACSIHWMKASPTNGTCCSTPGWVWYPVGVASLPMESWLHLQTRALLRLAVLPCIRLISQMSCTGVKAPTSITSRVHTQLQWTHSASSHSQTWFSFPVTRLKRLGEKNKKKHKTLHLTANGQVFVLQNTQSILRFLWLARNLEASCNSVVKQAATTVISFHVRFTNTALRKRKLWCRGLRRVS